MADTKSQIAGILSSRLKDGDVLGIGSGSTVEMALRLMGERIRNERLNVRGVVTSFRSAMLAEEAGITVLNPNAKERLTWAFDGADEVDPSLNLIKGRWGAMLNEKIIAQRAGGITVIVTEDKLVKKLGDKFAIPVEVIPEAINDAQEALLKAGAAEVKLRNLENLGLMITAHNNYILDARFTDIDPELEVRIKSIVGVVESGLFVNLTKDVLVAKPSGVFSLTAVNGRLAESRLI